MDFDAVADELYGTDRGDFVSLRGRRAAEARAHGERDLAGRIARLRKPTTAAALVNRLVRDRLAEVDTLLDLGERLRRAHADLAGDRIRTLTRQRADSVRDLTRRARELAEAEVGESVAREVETTLESAAADPDAAREVRVGRLTSALRPGDPFAGSWLPTEPAQARESAPRRGKRRRTGAAGRGPDPRGPVREPEPVPVPVPEPEPGPEPGPEPDRPREVRTGRQEPDRKAQRRRRRDREVAARKARDEAREELHAAEQEEARARERTEAARRALEAAEAELEDLP